MLSDARGLHFLSGGPGCGKTFTITYLTHSFNNRHVSCLPCATTGAAATRIGLGATTLHSIFSIPARNAFLSFLPAENPVYSRLQQARVIIIDEVSMLSPTTLGFVMYRLAQAHGLVHDIPLLLRQVLILLVGDHAQLPAIFHHKMPANQVCSQCQVYSSHWWDYVSMHELTIPVRHIDPGFADLIRIMRHSIPSQDLLDSVLAECMVTPADIPGLLKRSDITILCAYNAEVHQYNLDIMLATFPTPMLHTVEPGGSGHAEPALAAWFNDPKAHCLLLVAVGAKVMVLENIDVDGSVANGSMATVHSLKHRNGRISTVCVKVEDSQRLVNITRSCYNYTTYEGRRYARATFPLMVAYAMTLHKCQGATMDFVGRGHCIRPWPAVRGPL